MINIHELTTDHKIKLKKPMGCFDNLGENSYEHWL